jgi:hypothetical protein
MTAFLVLLALLAVVAVSATVLCAVRDGYGRTRTRLSGPHYGRAPDRSRVL